MSLYLWVYWPHPLCRLLVVEGLFEMAVIVDALSIIPSAMSLTILQRLLISPLFLMRIFCGSKDGTLYVGLPRLARIATSVARFE